MTKNWKKSKYRNKVFVLTGASGDIGKEVCRIFAPLGLRMYLLDLPVPGLDEIAEEVKGLGAAHVETMHMDVTNREQIESVIKIIGEKEKYIDILYNNAGIGNKVSITNGGTFEDYRKLMSINTDSMWLILQAALPYIGRPAPNKKFPNRREGQLIFSSSLGGLCGVPYMAAYAMSKHAIVALADCVRMEYRLKYGKDSIQVITTCAAPANTKFYSGPEMEKWRDNYKTTSWLFKFVEAEDVARRVMKASRKYKKEIGIPRYSHSIKVLNCWMHGYTARAMCNIENKKKK